MNTDVRIWLWSAHRDAKATLAALPAVFAEIEAELSRFRPDSALSRLNSVAGRGPQRVSGILAEVVRLALQAAASTGGLFDPTVLPALLAAGYSTSFGTIAAQGGVGMAVPPAGSLGPRWSEVAVMDLAVSLPAGSALDLGGIAKGWTADRIATLLRAFGPALVDAGGDVRASGAAGGRPWPVSIGDPRQSGVTLAEVELDDEAVVTSSIVRRRWQSGGQNQHHLIDPRTQRPAATDLLAVSVLGPTAAMAEVHAKAALIQGAAAGTRYLEARGLSGLLVGASGSVTAVGDRMAAALGKPGSGR